MRRGRSKRRLITPQVRQQALVSSQGAAPSHAVEPSFRPSINTALFLASILFAGLWTWFYSDWFAVFSGTIGLTTLLGVVPTVRSYMSKDRDGRYAKAIDNLLFQNAWATYGHVTILGLILVVGFGAFQPITLQATNTSTSTAVSVTLTWTASGRREAKRLLAEPGASHRLPVLRPQFGGPDAARITAQSLPVLSRDLSNYGWNKVIYPVDFWQAPALLLYPDPSVLLKLHERQPTLKIAHITPDRGNEDCVVQLQYLGEPVWFGTGGRALPIGANRVAGWREKAALQGIRSQGETGLESKVIGTSITSPCAKELNHGDILEWKLISADGSQTLFSGSITMDLGSLNPIEMAMK